MKVSLKFFLENKWLLILFILHTILLNRFFPLTEVFNEKPIITRDYPIHYYDVILGKLALSEGRFIFYNPYLLGGIKIDILRPGKDLLLYFLILPFSSTASIFKLYIFIFNLIFPFIIYLSARNFNLGKIESLSAMLLAIFAWQFNGWIRITIFPFIFSSILSIFSISVLYRYTTRKKKADVVIFLIIFLIATLIDVYSLVLLSIPFTILLYKKHNKIFYIILMIFAISLIWVYSYLENLIKYSDRPFLFQSNGLTTIIDDFRKKIVQSLIFVMGFLGIYLLRKDKDKTKFNLFLSTSIFYFIYSYFGSFINIISYLQPTRVLIPLSFLLVITSSISIKQLYIFLKKNDKRHLLIFLMILISISLFRTSEFYLEIKSQLQQEWDRKLTMGFTKEVENLICWIKANTTTDARILIENSGFKSEDKYGGYIIGLISYYANREIMGHSYPYISVKKEQLTPIFVEGVLFNLKNVSHYSLEELKYYFNIFNIKWIIAWSNESKETFEKYPEFIRKDGEIGEFSLYETELIPTYFFVGNGNITSSFNKIIITNTTANETTIKYLFFEELQTNPKLRIERYDNRLWLIKVYNGNVSDFEIYI